MQGALSGPHSWDSRAVTFTENMIDYFRFNTNYRWFVWKHAYQRSDHCTVGEKSTFSTLKGFRDRLSRTRHRTVLTTKPLSCHLEQHRWFQAATAFATVIFYLASFHFFAACNILSVLTLSRYTSRSVYKISYKRNWRIDCCLAVRESCDASAMSNIKHFRPDSCTDGLIMSR